MRTDLTSSIEAILIREEGFRPFVYDDATGSPIKPASLVSGHPTIGYGTALDVSPLSEEEALMLLRNRYRDIPAKLSAALSWFDGISTDRKAVFVCMAYQIGVSGFLKFTDTLHCASVGNWAGCSSAMLDSEWARKTPSRAGRMAAIIRNGM